MNIGAQQYRSIVAAAFSGQVEGYSADTLPAADAELIVAIAQLAMAADRVDDPDERALFDAVVGHVYAHANLETSAPSLAPIDDEEQRVEHLRSHAAQLAGKPSAALAFALAYALVIADLELAPEEGSLLESLRDALGLDETTADDLSAAVGEAVTPAE